MRFLILFCLITFFLTGLKSNAQLRLTDIETERIPQAKIREFIQNQQERNIITFSDIEPSVYPNASIEGYKVRENEYGLKQDVQQVWQHYLHSNPGDSWNGKKVSFGFLFAKKEKRLVYRNQFVSEIDTGMVVYINMKLMMGLKSLSTAFQFINIDTEDKIIEFSYLKGQDSEGKQRLQFFGTPNGRTRIVHTSFYKTKSVVKNKFLYPFFHTRLTNEFHRNMKRMIKSDMELLSERIISSY